MTVNHRFLPSLLAFFFFYSLSLSGKSESDSLATRDSLATEYYTLSDVDLDINSKRFLNVGLTGFQHFDLTSSIQQPVIWSRFLGASNIGGEQFISYRSLGNLGAAHHSLSYEAKYDLGADVGIDSYRLYEYDKNGIQFYPSIYPITELFYAMGSKKLQQFEVKHSQYLLRGLHVGLAYRRVNSVGFYQHQKTNHANFKTQAEYQTRNGRYKVFSYGIWNTLDAKENGGLLEDSFFQDSSSVSKSTIEVGRDSAESIYRTKNFFLQQYVVLGKKKEISVNDTTKRFLFLPSSRIFHSIEYLSRDFLFEDHLPDSVFYSDIFENWSYTSDVVQFLTVDNVLGWTTMSANNSVDTLGKIMLGINIKHQYAEYHQSDVDSFMTNMMVNFNVGKYQYSKFLWSIAGGYVFDGANAGDYSFSGNAAYLLKNRGDRFDLGIKSGRRAPGLMETTYSSNHYKWTNAFNKVDNTCGELSFTSNKINFSLGVKAAMVRNLIYYGKKATPSQEKKTVNILSAYMKQDFRIWKLHLDNKIIYQNVSKDKAVAIPEYIAYHSLYLEDRIFKNNMGIQVGADLYYNTSYFASAYMPATGQFYRQYSKEIGNYPFVDLFLNMSVKQARMFVKVVHVNSGMAGNTYYSAPGYPAADRTFIFGVSWIFFN